MVAARAQDALFGCGAALRAHEAAGAKVRTVLAPRSAAALARLIAREKPSFLYTHGPEDGPAGRRAHAAVEEALASLPPGTAREVRLFEPVARPAARPNLFVACGPRLAAKTKALKSLAAAAEARARLRGAQCGADAAESFTLAARIEP